MSESMHKNQCNCHILMSSSAIHAAQHHSEGKSLVVVRVPKRDELSLTTALDAGASGIVIPHCESAQEVKDFIKEMYYGMYSGTCARRKLLTDTFRTQRSSLLQPLDFHTRYGNFAVSQ